MEIFLLLPGNIEFPPMKSLGKRGKLGFKEKYWLLKKCELTEKSVNGKFG